MYQFKGYFRCKQSRHFVLFSWLVIILIIDQGKGKIKGLSRMMPGRIKYWSLMRMIRSGQWDVSIYARRLGVEVTIKELKAGLHIGQMQVTKDARRVERSVVLSVAAYLLLVRLYGRGECIEEGFSIFKLKHKFTADLYRQQLNHLEQKWREKLNNYRAAA